MQMPTKAPVMTLANVILFPQAMLPLHISEPRYRRMLTDALEGQRMFALAMQRPGRSRETPHPIAGLGLIRACVKNRDGTANLILQGIARVELGPALRYRPYRVHSIAPLLPASSSEAAVQTLMNRVLELVGERLELSLDLPLPAFAASAEEDRPGSEETFAAQAFRQVLRQLTKLQDPEQLVDLVSATLLPDAFERQVILQTRELEGRLRHLIRFLTAEIRRHQKKESP
jgi:ATP-dependent Lon protease